MSSRPPEPHERQRLARLLRAIAAVVVGDDDDAAQPSPRDLHKPDEGPTDSIGPYFVEPPTAQTPVKQQSPAMGKR